MICAFLILSVYLFSALPSYAQNIETCGDLGTDNRPNCCGRPDGQGGVTPGKVRMPEDR